MSDESQGMVRRWLTEPLSTEVAKSIDRIAAADNVQPVAIMPDVHLANDVCIGLAVATKNRIYPAAVGGDIGCGMSAVRFQADADLLADETRAARVLAGPYREVPANRHSKATVRVELPDRLQDVTLSHPALEKLKRRDGRVQFGTLGRGNHFLEFQSDQSGQLWLMVHSGSRAMGQAITAFHLSHLKKAADGLSHLAADTKLGAAYLSDFAWAIVYAQQNRRTMAAAVARLLDDLFGVGMDEATMADCHHNHVQRENHFGKDYWIHRKGAQAAQLGEPGIIPGSMATASFHVTGRGCEDSLCSSSHGAGRKLSRGEAKRTVSTRQFRRQMESVWYDHRLAHAMRDEAPTVYKDIFAVMRAQRELTRIERELRPLLSYKSR